MHYGSDKPLVAEENGREGSFLRKAGIAVGLLLAGSLIYGLNTAKTEFVGSAPDKAQACDERGYGSHAQRASTQNNFWKGLNTGYCAVFVEPGRAR
jgi:hypothetical protein